MQRRPKTRPIKNSLTQLIELPGMGSAQTQRVSSSLAAFVNAWLLK